MTPRQQDLIGRWVKGYAQNRMSRHRWIGTLTDVEQLWFAQRWAIGEAAKARIARGEMPYQLARARYWAAATERMREGFRRLNALIEQCRPVRRA